MFRQKFELAWAAVSNFIKKYATFVLAFFIGAIIIFPSVYFHYFESGYRGIEFFGSDGEEIYLTQIQEMYDGHYSMSNIYLAEGKNGPYVQQPLSPFLIMVLGRALQVSAPVINIITKFLFPFLLSLLVYVFFNKLLQRKGLAILLTVFVMLGPATLTFLNPGAWLAFFSKGIFVGADLQFLSYARPINPQVSLFFFFGYLVCIWKFLFEENKRLYGWLAAIILGLSFYTYFFTFSLLFAFNGVLGLWFLIKKNWLQFKKILAVTLGALILGIPYFINTVKVLNSSLYEQVAHRFGVAEGHDFVFSRIWWGAFLVLVFLYKKWDKFKIFVLAFLGAAFIVTNQQLITGRTVPIPSHYHWYFIAPIGGGTFLYLIFLQLKKLIGRKIFYCCLAFILVLFFCSAVQFQRLSYKAERDLFLVKQRYAPVVHWLANNLPQDKVVFGNSELSKLVPAYTNKNVYHHGGLGDFLVAENRLKHSLYLYTYLDGVTVEGMRDYVIANRHNVGVWLFSQTYRVKNGCYGCFPDAIIETLVSEYKDFNKLDFVGELKKYQIDYVAWDKEKEPAWKMDRFFKDPVYDDGVVVVYKVN